MNPESTETSTGPATLNAPSLDGSPDDSGALRVEVRGGRRSPRMVPRFAEGLRGRVRLPQPRRDGPRVYLKQWLLTALPLVLTDLVVLLAAIGLCSAIGLVWLNPDDPTSRAIVWIPSIAFTWLLINFAVKLYPGATLGMVDEIRLLTVSLTLVALITLSRQITGNWLYERSLFMAVAYCLCLVMAPLARNMVRKRLAYANWWGFPVLVCGDDATAFNVDQWLHDNRRLGLRPLGVVGDRNVLEIGQESTRYLGSWSNARRLAEENHAYWAILVEPGANEPLQVGMNTAIEQHLGNIPLVYIVSNVTGIPDHWDRHQMDEGLSGVMVEHHLLLPIPQMVKRGMDVAIVVIAGILLSPLFLALALIIKLTSRGPVFFGHERVGIGNTRFKAWKFRTMIDNAEAALEKYLAEHPELRSEWETTQKLKNDPRVTPIGRWMRKWSVDELPQLWNVLVGEMSAVGPRPIVPCEIEIYGEHFEIFCSVLPGMTGLWQVCGRNDTSFRERIQLGIYYIHHWSPWLDLYLLARTVRTILFTNGAY
jgi:Undecaprenyl-phosphate galactose phosphotransferase WbaP